MSRKRVNDPDELLDVAETLILERGVSGLTIDAVSRAAGISKGGVQYCFGNKEALISAMFHRWSRTYDAILEDTAPADSDAFELLKAHIGATGRSDRAANAKTAGLLAAFLQSPDSMSDFRDWYHERLSGLDTQTERGRRARLAFFAIEGAFMLRFFKLIEISDEDWADVVSDIVGILD